MPAQAHTLQATGNRVLGGISLSCVNCPDPGEFNDGQPVTEWHDEDGTVYLDVPPRGDALAALTAFLQRHGTPAAAQAPAGHVRIETGKPAVATPGGPGVTSAKATYGRYRQAMYERGVIVCDWAGLTAEDRESWDAALTDVLDAAAQQPQPDRSLLALVDAHFVGNGPYPLQLVCWTEDASDVECDTEITEVEPGVTWDELEARIVAHAAECHAAARAQTSLTLPDTTPQPAPMVRLTPCPAEGHDGAHIQWNSSGHWLCGQQVADALGAQGIFADRPEAEQPAPGSLRAALEETLTDWRDDAVYRITDTRDEITEHYAVTACADTLAGILAAHPDAESRRPKTTGTGTGDAHDQPDRRGNQ